MNKWQDMKSAPKGEFNYELLIIILAVIAFWLVGYHLLFEKPTQHTVHEIIRITIPPTICFETVDDVAAFYGISTEDAAKIEIPKECKHGI